MKSLQITIDGFNACDLPYEHAKAFFFSVATLKLFFCCLHSLSLHVHVMFLNVGVFVYKWFFLSLGNTILHFSNNIKVAFRWHPPCAPLQSLHMYYDLT